jgi:hypothetical protein
MQMNHQAFNELVGWILAQAYETHPERAILRFGDITPSIKESILEARGGSQKRAEKFWHDTVKWLADERFLTAPHRTLDVTTIGVKLTLDGLKALNSVPSNLDTGKSVGQQLVSELKETGREVRRETIAQIAGQFLGSFTRGLGSG